MAIGTYLKEIGRGKDGARALNRAQACDLFGQVLDGTVSDLELGAFCIAMRVKGETPEEMAGFLDATQQRLSRVPDSGHTTVVIPSYNGARKLPLLTPLLALLLAREGLPVLIHGTSTESSRVSIQKVLETLDTPVQAAITTIAPGTIQFVATATLCPGLQTLLEVRRTLFLRNPAHSLVKLMAPCAGRQVLVTSYTHPEYARSMAATLEMLGTTALLLRGTEGEAVADPRRTPKMRAFHAGRSWEVQAAQTGPLQSLPTLPASIDAQATAAFTRAVLDGQLPVPEPIAQQVAQVLHLARL